MEQSVDPQMNDNSEGTDRKIRIRSRKENPSSDGADDRRFRNKIEI
jgi:hypothetical protein